MRNFEYVYMNLLLLNWYYRPFHVTRWSHCHHHHCHCLQSRKTTSCWWPRGQAWWRWEGVEANPQLRWARLPNRIFELLHSCISVFLSKAAKSSESPSPSSSQTLGQVPSSFPNLHGDPRFENKWTIQESFAKFVSSNNWREFEFLAKNGRGVVAWWKWDDRAPVGGFSI